MDLHGEFWDERGTISEKALDLAFGYKAWVELGLVFLQKGMTGQDSQAQSQHIGLYGTLMDKEVFLREYYINFMIV